MDWIRRHRTEIILGLTALLFLALQQLFFPLRPGLIAIDEPVSNLQITNNLLTYYQHDTAEIVSQNAVTKGERQTSEAYNFVQNIWFSPSANRFAATLTNDQPASSANPLYSIDRPTGDTISVIFIPSSQTLIALPRVIASAVWLNDSLVLYQDKSSKKTIYAYDISKQKESTAITLPEDADALLVRQPNGEVAIVQGQTLLELDGAYKLKNRFTLPIGNITSLTYASPTLVVIGYQDKNRRPRLTRFSIQTNKAKAIIVRRMPKRGAIQSLQVANKTLYLIVDSKLYQVTLRSL